MSSTDLRNRLVQSLSKSINELLNIDKVFIDKYKTVPL